MRIFRAIVILVLSFAIFGPAIAQVGEFQAGPIWNENDAAGKCPKICASAGLGWTGGWRTTVVNTMSVCSCAPGSNAAAPDQPPAPVQVSRCTAPATEKCGGCSVICYNKRASCSTGSDSLGSGCFVDAHCSCQ